MASHPSRGAQADRQAESEPADRIVRKATEARQGEIILGRRGRWVWIAAFALMLVVAVALLLAY
jgi:hypothetical protein